MSTGHMPNPTDHLSTQASDNDVKGQTVPSSAPATGAAQGPAAPTSAAPATEIEVAPSQPALPLNEDMARLFEEQVGTIAQKLIYHSQTMYGVGGLGSDPVSARDVTLEIANALRTGSSAGGVHALVNLGDAQIAQVNDRTMPYRYNSQVAGLLEGILASVAANAYKDDPARLKDARTLLNSLFITANERLQVEAKVIPMMSQAPAMGNDFKMLTDTQAGTQSEHDAPALSPARSTDKG